MTWRRVHAIRGATTVSRDDAGQIRDAVVELLRAMIAANQLTEAEIVSAIFTVTGDLRSEFPARAARDLGWHDVPLLCMTEIPVPGSLARCIRVLVQIEAPAPRPAVRHVYLRGAEALRPDLSPGDPELTWSAARSR